MAYAYSLLQMSEAESALGQRGASELRTVDIEEALAAASQEINSALGREITEDAWIEYHKRSRGDPSVLRVLHWPPTTITEIAEDSTRAYGAATVLTANTDFIVDTNTGAITRVSDATPIAWLAGFEAIRIKVTGGWTLANVPPAVKDVCGEYMARKYHARVNQEHAFKSVDDARGTVSHFGPVMLTKPMRQRLSDYKDFGATTCVRYETA